jgi:hypothetical protein
MRIKASVLSVVVAGGLLAGIPRSRAPAHAAPSAARPAATCSTTVLQSAPLYNHVTIHGYASLVRNLCDGNVFLRISTDEWLTTVSGWFTGPGGTVSNWASLIWPGYLDTPEEPYTSGTTYHFDGSMGDVWTHYIGSGSYTAP